MSDVVAAHAASALEAEKKTSIAFLNWAHAIDHFVVGIYPTVVIGLVVVFERPYTDLIVLSSAMFFAFGACSLPAGWLGDHWSRRAMMTAFFFGCGLSLAAAGLSPNPLMLAASLLMLGVFASIYHPVGMAMLIEVSQARGRTLAFNGVCGNLGASLAAAITAAFAAILGWRWAFLIPAILCIVTAFAFMRAVPAETGVAVKKKKVSSVPLSLRETMMMFALYVVISISSGLCFNTVLIALPKLLDDRFAGINLVMVGGLATAVFLCGALAQLAVGRLSERFPPHLLFVAVVALQCAGFIWCAQAGGWVLIVALSVTMAAVYAQVTVGDLVIARYISDAYRSRVYAVRYFLTFISAGAAGWILKALLDRGGFNLVLIALAIFAAVLLVAVIGFSLIAQGAETKQQSAALAPAE